MTNKASKRKALEEALKEAQREVKEIRAQMASTYHFASVDIPLCSDRGGGILVEMTYLGGRQACIPFVVRDGLSQATIKALADDIRRSWDLATEMEPKKSNG